MVCIKAPRSDINGCGQDQVSVTSCKLRLRKHRKQGDKEERRLHPLEVRTHSQRGLPKHRGVTDETVQAR